MADYKLNTDKIKELLNKMEFITKDEALEILNRNSITKAITLSDGISIYDTIKNLPTADVVEVVRCRDCKNAKGNLISIDICHCLKYRDVRQGGDFCNYGERRASNETTDTSLY